MQNIAIKRSANARFTRKGRKSVLDLLPCLKTITTNTFPTTDKNVVSEYKTINPINGPSSSVDDGEYTVVLFVKFEFIFFKYVRI
jgi:hypothetical protein